MPALLVRSTSVPALMCRVVQRQVWGSVIDANSPASRLYREAPKEITSFTMS
jgi:hypothetical protein